MIRMHLPVKEDVSNCRAFDRTVGKAVILVSPYLAFLAINPIAYVFFDDHSSTPERTINPFWRGDLGVCSDDNQTHPALRVPLSRGEAMPCW